jgi:hypothetical protein
MDRRTHIPSSLEGEWPVLDDAGKELRRVRIRFLIDGFDGRVSIGIPEDAKDVAKDVVGIKAAGSSALPSAPLKPLPSAAFASGSAYGMESGVYATGTYSTTSKQFIDEKETDLYNKYMEELKRSQGQP